jgi:hypothetical protein
MSALLNVCISLLFYFKFLLEHLQGIFKFGRFLNVNVSPIKAMHQVAQTEVYRVSFATKYRMEEGHQRCQTYYYY